ncbi:MAG TPA: DUF697 domain-containing protein [Stellaceae bacterium]|jgi:uncharacterized protein (DUF697 family)|nr:DUF697 domain-containing protein [Stellaceae bacterium]
MTRKQLPKAILRSGGDLRAVAAAATLAVDEEVSSLRSGSSPFDALEARIGAIFALPVAPRGPQARPAVSIYVDPLAERRRTLARRIVERHKMYAAMGGLFPLAVVNVAGVTAIVLRMVHALSRLYGVPFERDHMRSMIIALMGGSVPTGLAAAAASSLAFVVPGAGFVGLAVSSISAASFTRGIGLVFIERFENGLRAPGEIEAAAA